MYFHDGLLSTSALLNLLAQTPDAVAVPVPVPVEQNVPVYGPQFFIALLSGVILAFGFQLLLTNLSIATGVSYVAHSSNSSSSDSSNSSGSTVKTIGMAFGIWTLLTVCASLFFACWLAIRLTVYTNPLLGAITGLVVWATYFSLLMWFSSTAAGSLIGSVVSSATNSLKTITGAAAAAIGAKGAGDQVVQTAEAAAAAVRRELTADIDTDGIKESLQSYIGGLKSADVDVDSIEKEFERLIRGSELVGADRDALPQVDTDKFAQLLSDRTDLSKEETKRLSKRLYRVWQNNTGSSQGLSELMTFVASATGGQLASKGLSEQLSKLVQEVRGQNQSSNQNGSSPSPLQQVASQGLSSVMGMVMGKVDLPEMDANTIVGQLKSAQDAISSSASSAAPDAVSNALSSNNTIKLDVENYIRHAFIGELKSEALEEAFANVLFDPEADKAEIRHQLSSFGRKVFTQELSARGMLTQSEIRDIANRMEIVRQRVLKDVTAAEAVEAEKRIRQQLETFLKYTPASELNSEMGEKAFKAIIETDAMETSLMRTRLGKLDADYMRQFLLTRDDVAAHDVSERYAKILERYIADSEGIEKAAKVRLQQQQASLEDYLRSTNKAELDPDGIKRDVQKLLDEPNEGIRRMRTRLAHFDRTTLTSLLAQRPEFSEQDIDSVLDSVEEIWTQTLQAPQTLSNNVQMKYDEATSAIANYLRSTGKPELSPTGIKRDLQKLLDNPKVGAQAIRFRLSKMDRDTLVQLLSQRDDLSADEVNQTIDSVLSTVQDLVKAPRRLARRAKSSAQSTGSSNSQGRSFQTALEDYLSNTNKDELNPSGIKRDLKLLLNDPKHGASKLGDRIAQMDDSTMVAILAQRPDMTREEAEAAVARIADVRHQVKGQIRSVQRSLESVVDRIFASIRNYLQSLDRPELDYYGIKRDVSTLFSDPKSGFSAIGDRLSSFDRDTIVALVSSHDRISESDAYRVVDQIESARDSAVRKAENLERQFEQRVSAVKAQTQKQIEDTKKAAEIASWWLFGTALLSALVSAWGGWLAGAAEVIG